MKKHTKILLKKINERVSLEDLGIGGKIILRRALNLSTAVSHIK
jgi:hypothetical protein